MHTFRLLYVNIHCAASTVPLQRRCSNDHELLSCLIRKKTVIRFTLMMKAENIIVNSTFLQETEIS